MIGATLIAFGLSLAWLYLRLERYERRNTEYIIMMDGLVESLDARVEVLERALDPYDLTDLSRFGMPQQPRRNEDEQ